MNLTLSMTTPSKRLCAASDRYILLKILYVRDNPRNGLRQASLVK